MPSTASFDPYRKWLGIPREEQPANHYRLLGIRLFEDDPDVISNAADRQMAHVRNFQSGQHSTLSQQLLNELSAARLCLLTPEKKAAYDAQLRAILARQAQAWTPPEASLERNLAGAGRFVLVQARRAWLVAFRLPGAYQALGRELFEKNLCPEELSQLRDELGRCLGDLAQLQARGTAEAVPLRPGPWQQATGWVSRWWRSLRLGSRAGACSANWDEKPTPGIKPRCNRSRRKQTFARRCARANAADQEIARLSEVPNGQLLSPKRLLWILLGILVGLYFFLWGLARLL